MMEHAVNIYRTISQFPQINHAEFLLDETEDKKELCLQVTWINRDLFQMKNVKSYGNYFVSGSNIISPPASPETVDVILRRISPSGKKIATICQNTDKMYLHVAEPEGQQQVINLKALDVHGMIYSDPYISSLDWSTDEEYILYIAEEMRPQPIGHYDPKLKTNRNCSGFESKYLYRDDWGEQMRNQHQSVVVKLNIYTKNVTAVRVGKDLTAGEAIFVPFTHEVVGAATVCHPVRLGRAYSSDREALIFHIDECGETVTELTGRGLHAERPRFSPDGTKCIYLQSSTFGPVVPTAQIWLLDWPSKKQSLLLDYVATKMEVSGSKEFMGVCAKTEFPSRCWDSTSSRIYFSALSHNTYMLCEMDVESKYVRVFSSKSSHVLLDVKGDHMLVKKSSATEPDCLLLGQIFPKEDPFQPCFRPLTLQKSLPNIPNDWYDIFEFPVAADNKFTDISISAMYIGPTSKIAGQPKRPIILWPHGGPHAIAVNVLNHWFAFVVTMGYSIVLPNYRGSCGMGQSVMNASFGNCGLDDVEDCKQALDVCLQRFADVLDSSQIYGVGLSHGGFLMAHLTSKYPDMMKAVCLMNSAIDIQLMATASDIPEWAFLEYGLPFKIGRSMDKEAILRMYERSPVSHIDKVKTPTMLILGSEDARCPPAISVNYHRLLLARNIPTRMYIYKDNHPLSSLEAESDAVIQIMQWFHEHCNNLV